MENIEDLHGEFPLEEEETAVDMATTPQTARPDVISLAVNHGYTVICRLGSISLHLTVHATQFLHLHFLLT